MSYRKLCVIPAKAGIYHRFTASANNDISRCAIFSSEYSPTLSNCNISCYIIVFKLENKKGAIMYSSSSGNNGGGYSSSGGNNGGGYSSGSSTSQQTSISTPVSSFSSGPSSSTQTSISTQVPSFPSFPSFTTSSYTSDTPSYSSGSPSSGSVSTSRYSTFGGPHYHQRTVQYSDEDSCRSCMIL